MLPGRVAHAAPSCPRSVSHTVGDGIGPLTVPLTGVGFGTGFNSSPSLLSEGWPLLDVDAPGGAGNSSIADDWSASPMWV